MNILRIKKLIFLHLQHLPMKSRAWRPLVCKWGGVQIISPKRTFIGEGVIFDTNYPQDIFQWPVVQPAQKRARRLYG